jgi:D-arabinose 1-dehydrogenase-like Zn-dependent alcohol dehydrogenase
MADCVATIYRAVVRQGEVKPIHNVMVQGIGGLGLSAVIISKLVGARVIAVDIMDEKLDFAKKMGADEVVNASREKVPEAVKRLTEGRGADRIIDLVGSAKSVVTSFETLAPSGRLVQVGHSWDDVTLKVRQMMIMEIGMVGVSANTRQDLLDTLNLAASGKIKIKPIITDTFRLAQVNEVIEKMKRHEILGRAVVKP